ncbi:MAG TPA: M56 family metallopeptidase [Planctomycetaceae bacterium]
MQNLLSLAMHNTVVALVFALCVYGLTRVWRNPPVAHVLWLLVLLKLVAPPMMRIEWSALRLPDSPYVGNQFIADVPRMEGQNVDALPPLITRPTARTTRDTSTTGETERDYAAGMRLAWSRGEAALLWFWLGGAVCCALVAVKRSLRFEQILRETQPASPRLQRLTREIAGKLGLRRVPDVRHVECVQVPMLWCAGRRPTIVLPMRLTRQLDDQPDDRLDEQRVTLILAHELAHLRRRDHVVRGIELIISVVYWWNPLVWLIRRQIHEAEDLCCDAWVRWTFPAWTKLYAEVLLETAESLTASQVGARLLPASPLLRSLSLKARIEMILQSRFVPHASTRSMVAVALLALLVLPTFVQTRRTQARAGSNDDATATQDRKPEAPSTGDFPHVVKFEQGATRFANDDKITIVEIRGTADTFSQGNIYRITGTYTLASRDRAILLASITVNDLSASTMLLDLAVRADHVMPGRKPIVAPGHATGIELKVQRQTVSRGTGKFTLYLPMSHAGLPHVSFYSVDNGEGFGGNYFGTGDSVLKKWWATEETDRQAIKAPAQKAVAPTAADFPQAVKFEQGATDFMKGDNITIVEVRGTADKFAPGNSYLVKGTYALTSHDQATLAAYITATDAENGTGESQATQTTVLNKGHGTFTLVLPMSCRGMPHVSFYSAAEHGSFGGNYFGTGDSVLKKWWGSEEKF